MSDRFARLPAQWITSAVLSHLSAADLKVSLALGVHVDRDYCCHPSVARIANLTGLAERSVTRSLRRLESLGLVVTRRGAGPGGTNSYRVTPDPSVTPDRAVRTPLTEPSVPPDRRVSQTSQEHPIGHPSLSTPSTIEDQRLDPPPSKPSPNGEQHPEKSRGQRFVDELVRVAPSVAVDPGTGQPDGRVLGVARIVNGHEPVDAGWLIDTARRLHEQFPDGHFTNRKGSRVRTVSVWRRQADAHVDDIRRNPPLKTIGEICDGSLARAQL